MVFKGAVSIYLKDSKVKVLEEKAFFDASNILHNTDPIHLVAEENSILFRINKADLYDFMIRHYELTEGILFLTHSGRIELQNV
jgi:signal-transduction protein with cAMP-binding, CBS, and nucleotidyltransferase domain